MTTTSRNCPKPRMLGMTRRWWEGRPRAAWKKRGQEDNSSVRTPLRRLPVPPRPRFLLSCKPPEPTDASVPTSILVELAQAGKEPALLLVLRTTLPRQLRLEHARTHPPAHPFLRSADPETRVNLSSRARLETEGPEDMDMLCRDRRSVEPIRVPSSCLVRTSRMLLVSSLPWFPQSQSLRLV